MSRHPLLATTAAHAAAFLDSLDTRPVGASASPEQLRAALDRPLPITGSEDRQVIDELVRDTEGGLLGSAGGRFFGWVIGGAVPAALAADWLTSAWDQNAAMHACAPAEAVIEEITGRWLKELLELPAESSFAFTTGAQAAHLTALAAARGKLLADRGWDVERQGLAGAPVVRVVTTGSHHPSIDRAARLLGIGSDQVLTAPGLAACLSEVDGPVIVCLQAGEINTGRFDPFPEAIRVARAHGAWVHVDGAFGLWAAASPRHRHLTEGVELADSWTTDGHKWLNVPFDSGFVFVRHAGAHRAAMSADAAYLVRDAGNRDQLDWNPEWSRRGRAVAVYAAIRAMGRDGIAAMIERCCAHAHRLTTGIAALPGAELVAEPVLNQGLVRFPGRDTDAVIAAVRDGGEAWFGGTTWNGQRAMRISVVNWQTGEEDVARAVAAVRAALSRPAAASPDGR